MDQIIQTVCPGTISGVGWLASRGAGCWVPSMIMLFGNDYGLLERLVVGLVVRLVWLPVPRLLLLGLGLSLINRESLHWRLTVNRGVVNRGRIEHWCRVVHWSLGHNVLGLLIVHWLLDWDYWSLNHLLRNHSLRNILLLLLEDIIDEITGG